MMVTQGSQTAVHKYLPLSGIKPRRTIIPKDTTLNLAVFSLSIEHQDQRLICDKS